MFIDNNQTRLVSLPTGEVRVETISAYRIQWFQKNRGWAGSVRNNVHHYIIKERDLRSLHDDDQTRKKGGV